MIYSMTGYGKGVAEDDKTTVEVEVKSVNSRYLDISLRLPSSLMNKENELREFIKGKVKRGKLSIIMQIKRNNNSSDISRIDREKLADYLSVVNEIKNAANLKEEIKLEHLLNNKELFIAQNGDYSEDEFNLLKSAIDSALQKLIIMKSDEGKELAKDLQKRILIIEEKLSIIEEEASKSLTDYYAKLKERINILLEDASIEKERLDVELAIIADKADITEECVRMKSHIKFFMESIEKGEEPGRKLNFLCQELNRETNTISSKSISTLITHNTVQIKEEIEKIREQIQNIE